jgi:5'(3')-deoxyribonucleotidase
MNRRMRVAVDMDGVLYDWIGEMVFLLREHRGLDIKRTDITSWWTKEKIGPKDWDWLWEQRELFQDGNLISGSKRGYELLKKIADAPIITSRPHRVIADTYLWLALHRFPCQELHILGGGQSKTLIPWDAIIDDKIEHAVDAAKAGRRAIVFSQPWNRDFPKLDVGLYGLIHRVENWKEVLDCVNEIALEISIEEAQDEQDSAGRNR